MPLLQVGSSSYAVVGGLRGLSPARGLGAWGSCLNGCLDYSLGARLAMAFAGIASTMAPGVLITNASGVNAVLPALYAAYVANMDKAAPAAGARQPCCLSLAAAFAALLRSLSWYAIGLCVVAYSRRAQPELGFRMATCFSCRLAAETLTQLPAASGRCAWSTCRT